MIYIGADRKLAYITFIGFGVLIVLPIDKILDQTILKGEVIEARRDPN